MMPCAFCGQKRRLTKEHVFPKWLRTLGYTGDGWRELLLNENEDPKYRVERGSPFNKTVKIVCGPCNNEWMGGVESDAKPILIGLFNANQQVQLDSPAQLTLARWSFKTVCVLSRLRSRQPPIPGEHLHELFAEGRPPVQSQIWIGTASGAPHPQGVQLAEVRILPHIAHVTIGVEKFDVSVYQARFRLMNVFFDVFGYNHPGLGLEQAMGGELSRALLPIWPQKHPTLWWPPVQTLDAVGGILGLEAIPLKGLPGIGTGSGATP